MRLLYLIMLTNIWSSASVGQQGASLISTQAFQKIDRSIFPYKCGPAAEVSNMPRIKSIGTWRLCGAESARSCAQWYVCKQRNIADCSNLKPEEEISTLSMQAWAWISYDNPKMYGDPSLHRNLNLLSYDKSTKRPFLEGGFGALSLSNSRKSFSFYSDACYPFDQFSNTNRFPSEAAAISSLVRAEKFYEENKRKTEGFCEDCFAREIGNQFGIIFDRGKLSNALSSNTFNQFMFELIFAGCRKKISEKPPTFGEFPQVSDADDPKFAKGNYNKTHIGQKISEIIEKNKAPVNLDGICFAKNKENGNQCEYHDLAISGFDKVCKNANCTDCRERIKVHNSWGSDWQKDYTDDGYIDKQSVLNNLRDPLLPSTLTWIY